MRPYYWFNSRLLGCLLLILLLAGCAGSPVNESARLEQQDSLAAVQIKARLLEATELAGSAIDVDLEGDRAILSGFVETSQQRDRAEAIAHEQDQVKTVENNITVK
ncbi:MULTISPECIES: BON domain-containing protein [Vreelandella]|jgi:osmotically-inducible protein OsmY|uniref:BON domain-containing protein n=1 Tax=Vreelandella TaxID=3137766 RepID=UPI003002AF92|tara:strand:+ start:9251 stop:9568 length:318 start_codon:yes stop_codon:yes gene_type:complete